MQALWLPGWIAPMLAFWLALGLHRRSAGREHALRFGLALATGAFASHAGYALWLAPAEGSLPARLLDPTGGASLSFLPAGLWVLAPRACAARQRFLAEAVRALPLPLALARLGCLAAGCCHGLPTALPWGVELAGVRVHPTPAYEIAGWLLLQLALCRCPTRLRPALFLCGFAGVRLAVGGWRLPDPAAARLSRESFSWVWLALGVLEARGRLRLHPVGSGPARRLLKRGGPGRRPALAPERAPAADGRSPMGRVRSFSIGRPGRWLRLLGALWLLALGPLQAGAEPRPRPPLLPARGEIEAPGGWVHVPSGAWRMRRVDLSLDTRLGPLVLAARYDSVRRSWHWSFEPSLRDGVFTSPKGSTHRVGSLLPGDRVPGAPWVVLGERRLRTLGGLIHRFDVSGRLERIHWASSDTPSLELEGEEVAGTLRSVRILQCTVPGSCEELVRLERDGAGRLLAIHDHAGRSARFVWSSDGLLLEARSPVHVERGTPGSRYEYAGGALVARVAPDGERIEASYQAGRLVTLRLVGEESPEHHYTYGGPDPGTGLSWMRHTDPGGHASLYQHDGEGHVTLFENPLGERTRWETEAGGVTREVSPAGVLRRWEYPSPDVVVETQPSGNRIVYRYALDAEARHAPEHAPLLRAEDGLGLLEERRYDASGRLVAIVNGAGEETRLGYHADQMPATLRDPAGIVTELHDYGVHGHPGRVVRGSRQLSLVWDAVGNLVSGDLRGLTRGVELGGVVSRGYDASRRLVRIELSDLDAGSATGVALLEIERRGDGRRRRVRRPHGGDTELAYDALGRLRERRERADGTWHVTRFSWDASGRLLARSFPNGMRQVLQRDAAGRPVHYVLERRGALESELAVTLRDGRLVRLLDSLYGAPEHTYHDVAGRPVLVRHPGGEVTTFAYDLRGRPVQIAWHPKGGAGSHTLEIDYDSAGREVALRHAGRDVLRRRYESGRLAEIVYASGLRRRFEYDGADGRVARVESRDASGALREASDYQRLACGGLACWIARTRSFGALERITTDHYVLGPASYSLYPHAGRRVVMDHRSVAWFDHAHDGFYSYDALSNLTERIRGGETPYLRFVYNEERNRLRRIESAPNEALHSYVYDEAGFVVERDGEPITWDAGGRPTGVGSAARLSWDTLGRPRARVLGGVEQRLCFGGRLECDAAGLPTALDLSELRLDLATGRHRYRHFDPRGNVKLVSDADAEIETHYAYSAYAVESVHGDDSDPVRFALGRDLGGLVLLGPRLYDGDAARFLAPDPLEVTINGYAYALGNPVWLWDPAGAEAFDVASWGMTVATVGAGLALTPAGQGVGGILFGLGVAITVYGGTLAAAPSGAPDAAGAASPEGAGAPSGSGGAGPAPPAAGAPGAVAPSACAASGAELPQAVRRWLLVGVALQVALGLAWMHTRRRGGS